LSPEDKSYVAHISARIVGMFQRYAGIIDPENEHFLAFIYGYLANVNVKNPTAMPYSELCKHIKEGIRAYLRQLDSERKASKDDTISR
jgi:hypothetical protein